MAAKKTFDQQGVINLRPDDMFVVMQNGVEKRMLAKGLLDYLTANFASSDMSGYVTTTALNAAITNFITSNAVNTMINNALTNYITASQLATALAGYQPYVAPSAAIPALAASIATISILGIGVMVAADGQADRTAINAILVALRAHGIISP